MKKRFSITLILIIAITVLLTSCSNQINSDEAGVHIEGFLKALEAEDYEDAEKYLHPERPASLEEFCDELKIDFSDGVEIKSYEYVKTVFYDGSVSGSTYYADIYITVGEATVPISVELVRNNNGFGIYNFDVHGQY